MAPPAPVAAVLSNKFYVESDQMRDNPFDIHEENVRTKRNDSGIIESNKILSFREIYPTDTENSC